MDSNMIEERAEASAARVKPLLLGIHHLALDPRSAVPGARDDRCRDRPPLRGDNQDRRHADARA
jgi:hypothetical protein